MSDLEKNQVKRLITDMFEQGNGQTFWFDAQTVSGILGFPLQDLQSFIMNDRDFVENRKLQITTRDLYRLNTPFWFKLIHAIKNKID